MSTTPAPIRTLAAEARAVEAGHRAFLHSDSNGPHVRVVSDTVRGKSYRVQAFGHMAADGAVVFTCQPEGVRAYRDDHGRVTGEPGAVPCQHAALAARRLERSGLARWQGGRWVATVEAPAPTPNDDDPFAGFPQGV